MKQSSAKYIGMDVHKDSIDIAVAASGARGEVRHYGTVGGGLADVDRALRKIAAAGGELHLVYEAGPCGYALHRHLTVGGIDCTVVAPSRIPKRAGYRVKTDRRGWIADQHPRREDSRYPARSQWSQPEGAVGFAICPGFSE